MDNKLSLITLAMFTIMCCTFVSAELPAQIDWRTAEEGDDVSILGVYEQSEYYNLWPSFVFAVINNIEALYAEKTGKLVSLSKQIAFDCAHPDQILKGKNTAQTQVFLEEHLIGLGQLPTSDELPLEAMFPETVTGCTSSNNYSSGVQIKGYEKINNHPWSIKNALITEGPLTAIMNPEQLPTYTGGIILNCKKKSLAHHPVLIVGYGSDDGIDYFIVKNYAGPNWGEGGFFYIQQNACGINRHVKTAILA